MKTTNRADKASRQSPVNSQQYETPGRGKSNERIDSRVAAARHAPARPRILRGGANQRGVRCGVGARGDAASNAGEQGRAGAGANADAQSEVEAMMEKMLRDLCSISQAADTLGIDESQARRLARAGRIAARKIDTAWVVYVPSLARYPKTKWKRGDRPTGRVSGQNPRTKLL